jgi:ribosome-associated protein
MTQEQPDQMETLRLCCRALDDKKAEDLKVLDVSDVSSITDYFIIASGTSEPHLRALTNEVSQVLKEHRVKVIGKDLSAAGGWNVVDAFDIIVHLFLPETRDYYRLDSLWKDAPEVEVATLLPAEPRQKV